MSYIAINKPMLDYFTITSFDKSWFNKVNEIGDMVTESWEWSQRQQYTGKLRRHNNGTYFSGNGKQKGIDHYILQIDGSLAHDVRYHLFDFYPAYVCKCTRMDIQTTIRQPSDWSQWDLLVRFKEKYGEHLVGYPKPNKTNGKLMQTVYQGNRTGADRYLRVYQKLSDESQILLRLETELKRRRAPAVFLEMCKSNRESDVDSIMKAELKVQSQKDAALDKLFYPHISGHRKIVRVKTSEGNTADWIIDTCLPSIAKHLNSHSADRRVDIETQLVRIVQNLIWKGNDDEWFEEW